MIKYMNEDCNPSDILALHNISEQQLRKLIMKSGKGGKFTIGENEYHYYAPNANKMGVDK